MRRRSLLIGLGGSLGLGSLGYIVHRLGTAPHASPFRNWRDAPTEALSRETTATLLLITKTIIGMPIEESHYALRFAWRAKNIGGYAYLYRRFVAFISSRRHNGVAFPSADAATQETIVREAMTSHDDADGLLAAYRQYIVQDCLQVFSKTDALIAIGYESFGGTARGLKDYLEHPSKSDARPHANTP